MPIFWKWIYCGPLPDDVHYNIHNLWLWICNFHNETIVFVNSQLVLKPVFQKLYNNSLPHNVVQKWEIKLTFLSAPTNKQAVTSVKALQHELGLGVIVKKLSTMNTTCVWVEWACQTYVHSSHFLVYSINVDVYVQVATSTPDQLMSFLFFDDLFLEIIKSIFNKASVWEFISSVGYLLK